MQLQQNKSSVKSQDGGSFSELLYRYLPYWPLFIVIVLLFVIGAYCFLLTVIPKYEATASLMVKDEQKGNNDSKSMESLEFISTKKIVENETEVLKSWVLMKEVTKKLHLYAPIYEEGRFRTASAYITSPITIEAKDPDSIKPVDRVDLRFNQRTSVVTLSDRYEYKLNKWVETPYGTLRFSANKKYQKSQRSRPLFFTLMQPEKQAKSLVDDLKVGTVSKLAAVIELTYKDEMPQRAVEILNELMSTYNSAIINDKKSLAANTVAFVDERMNIVARELDSIERQIQNYKTGTGAIDIRAQSGLVMQNVSDNDQKLSELDSRLRMLNQVEKLVSSKDKGGSIVPATLSISDPGLSHMLDKLYEAELEHERLKSTVGAGHPLIGSINDQIAKIKPNILENIESQRKSLEASRSAISSTNSMYNSILSSIPQKERDLLDISRDQSIKNNIYSFLLQKREESAISVASTVSDMKIVDLAQASSGPVSPDKRVIYGISILAALVLVFAIITAKEALSRKLLYRHEIESYTSVPIIGEIAYKKQKEMIVVEHGVRSILAEEFRKIRITLPYLGIGPSKKKILVTSSIAGEGKSFVASNLAQTLALTGKKVVLIDMDLHNPSLEKIMTGQTHVGVSEFINGEASYQQIINETTFNSNLLFVPSGAIPSNPSELICNEKVKELIDYLENAFDYVIIDTAPIIPVSDAYTLSSYCNATLFVVRHKYTPKMLIRRMDEGIKINPLTNPAIIFNGVHNRGFVKNSYGYGYGYTYVLKQDDKSKTRRLLN
jgi:capsular exopolysaccharide synthesis family protein